MKEPSRNSAGRSIQELRLVRDMRRRLQEAQRRNRVAPNVRQRPPRPP